MRQAALLVSYWLTALSRGFFHRRVAKENAWRNAGTRWDPRVPNINRAYFPDCFRYILNIAQRVSNTPYSVPEWPVMRGSNRKYYIFGKIF
jgi:hypothetical protein